MQNSIYLTLLSSSSYTEKDYFDSLELWAHYNPTTPPRYATEPLKQKNIHSTEKKIARTKTHLLSLIGLREHTDLQLKCLENRFIQLNRMLDARKQARIG